MADGLCKGNYYFELSYAPQFFQDPQHVFAPRTSTGDSRNIALLCQVALTDTSETLFGGPPKSLLEKLANCTVTSLVLFLATLISIQLWGDLVLRHVPFP